MLVNMQISDVPETLLFIDKIKEEGLDTRPKKESQGYYSNAHFNLHLWTIKGAVYLEQVYPDLNNFGLTNNILEFSNKSFLEPILEQLEASTRNFYIGQSTLSTDYIEQNNMEYVLKNYLDNPEYTNKPLQSLVNSLPDNTPVYQIHIYESLDRIPNDKRLYP